MISSPNNKSIPIEQVYLLNSLLQNLETLEERKHYLLSLDDYYPRILEDTRYYIDQRDLNIYTVIQVGNQYWMGENLRFKVNGAYCNPQNPSINYGYLYDWATCMQIEEKYNEEYWEVERPLHKGLAPEGWYIPSDKDWAELELVLGVNQGLGNMPSLRGTNQGNQLKAFSEFHHYGGHWTSVTDSLLFNALPAGYFSGDTFKCLGQDSLFWTTTQYSKRRVWDRGLNYRKVSIIRDRHAKAFAFSCRCFKPI